MSAQETSQKNNEAESTEEAEPKEEQQNKV